MGFKISKISGIYQIKNNINGKIYIGRSINIILRWYTHLDGLFKGIHKNSKLQEDFNIYGLFAFNFSVLELVKGKKELITKEQEYLNKINFNDNYNIYNSIKQLVESESLNINNFIEYMKSKWIKPNSSVDIKKYQIYKDEDRQEITNKAIECNILNEYKSHITFNKVINFMKDTLGYTIEDGRFRIKRKQYRYKLIIDFDEEFMEEN